MTSRILTKGKGGLRRGVMACAFCFLMLSGWQLAHGLAVDTRSYDPGSGVEVKAGEEELTMRWNTPEGSRESLEPNTYCLSQNGYGLEPKWLEAGRAKVRRGV